MTIQVVTLSAQELQSIVTDAYKEGYVKAQREWATEKTAIKAEPKFGEILVGVKELRSYLEFKGYFKGSVSFFEKVAPQLLETNAAEKQGKRFQLKDMEKTISTTYNEQEFQALLIDCVNACLKHNKQTPPLENSPEFKYIPIQDIFKKKICSKPTFYEHLKKGEFNLYKFGNKSFVDMEQFLKAFHKVQLHNMA